MNHWSWTQLICKCNFKNANCKCKHTYIQLKWWCCCCYRYHRHHFYKCFTVHNINFSMHCMCAVKFHINAPKWRVNILFSCIHCIIYIFYRRCQCNSFDSLKPSNLIECHRKISADWNCGIESSSFEEWSTKGIDKFPLYSSYIFLFFPLNIDFQAIVFFCWWKYVCMQNDFEKYPHFSHVESKRGLLYDVVGGSLWKIEFPMQYEMCIEMKVNHYWKLLCQIWR